MCWEPVEPFFGSLPLLCSGWQHHGEEGGGAGGFQGEDRVEAVLWVRETEAGVGSSGPSRRRAGFNQGFTEYEAGKEMALSDAQFSNRPQNVIIHRE